MQASQPSRLESTSRGIRCLYRPRVLAAHWPASCKLDAARLNLLRDWVCATAPSSLCCPAVACADLKWRCLPRPAYSSSRRSRDTGAGDCKVDTRIARGDRQRRNHGLNGSRDRYSASGGCHFLAEAFRKAPQPGARSVRIPNDFTGQGGAFQKVVGFRKAGKTVEGRFGRWGYRRHLSQGKPRINPSGSTAPLRFVLKFTFQRPASGVKGRIIDCIWKESLDASQRSRSQKPGSL